MKRHISFLMMLCMILSFCAFGAAPAMTDDWELPEGTPMFEPGCVMEMDFGTFTVLDAGFAKKVEMLYSSTSQAKTVNGAMETRDSITEYYYNAEDGSALFVVKGILQNSTSNTFSTKEIHPLVSFGAHDQFSMDAFPAVELTGSGTTSPGWIMDLEPGTSINVCFACTVPSECYYGNSDISLQLSGAVLKFQKLAIKSYITMGFGDSDGEPTADVITLVSNAYGASQAQPQESHVDEISIEAVSIEPYSSDYYNMRVQFRNNGIPALEGRHLISSNVQFTFLDKDGNGIPANASEIGIGDIIPIGQSAWTTSIHSISKNAVDTAAFLSFSSSYEFRYSQNALGEWKQIRGEFSEPVQFNINDILPKRSVSFSIENLSIDFEDKLPSAITKLQSYSAGMREGFNYELNSSETYAVIRFSITNLTKRDIVLNDLSGNFVIELNYDDGFLYSTNGSKPSFLRTGNLFSVLYHPSQTMHQRIGDEITLPPLVTYDVELYLPCAKVVGSQTDKSIVICFKTSQPEDLPVELKIR